jgi:very-short-patch-repair endonuclease
VAEVFQVAARQRGIVTAEQLRHAGVSRRTIDRWLASGWLHPMYRAVYLVGHAVAPPFARELGAVLALGEHALIGYRTGVYLWEMLPVDEGDVDVIVVGRKRASRPGIRVHRTTQLDRHDWTRRHGIPVTSAARTILDFAEQATFREIERAYDEALFRRWFTPPQLQRLIDKSPGRHGAHTLATLIARTNRPSFSRSEGEEVLRDLLRAADLPPPERNYKVGKDELDFYWARERVNLELDSDAAHRYRRDVDNRRDARLQAMGITVIRASGHELAQRPEAIVARVAQALALSPYSAPTRAAAQ